MGGTFRSPGEEEVISEEIRSRPTRLYAAHRLLDGFLGGFQPGDLVLLNSASPFVHHLTFQLCVRHILDFDRDVIYVDGGNTINPYTIASIARRYGLPRQRALGRIRVARAFTAYQMATILLENLEEEVRSGPGLLVLSCLPDLFLDEEVDYREAYHLLRRGLRKARDLVKEEELFGLVTNHGLSKLSRRRGVGNLLHQMADRVVRMRPIKGGLLLSLPKEGKSMPFIPAPPHQSLLEDFLPGGLGSPRTPSIPSSPCPTPTEKHIQITTFR